MTLADKSMSDLRARAQALGVPNVFALEKKHLIQHIELKQAAMVAPPPLPIPPPQYDARLMTKPPSKSSDRQAIEELLEPYVARGLHLTFPDPETWSMAHGKREDSGSMRMPLRDVLGCARAVMK